MVGCLCSYCSFFSSGSQGFKWLIFVSFWETRPIRLIRKDQTQLQREITAGKRGNCECFAGVGGLFRIASGEITTTCPLHTSNIHTFYPLTYSPF